MAEITMVEKLMKLDRGKLREVPTEQIKAQRLSGIAGEDIFITIRAIPGELHSEISEEAIGKDGKVSAARSYEAQAMLCVEGITEPNLRDHDLQRHFGAATPKDLAKLLFQGGELSAIANEISRISGFIDYELVKN